MKKHLIFLLLAILCFSLGFITTDNLLSQTNRGMKTITVHTKEGKAIELYKDSYALVVGNGNYTNGWDSLDGTLKDVKEVAAALEKHGFNVTLKMDLKKVDFDTAFEAFIRNGRDENSRLLFYYAGHGHTETLRTGEKLGYLVMVDSPMPTTGTGKIDGSKNVDMESLVTQAKRIDALHVLYMFDSCFSGSILNARNIPQPPAIQDSVKYPVRQFITAGRANEPVPDYSRFKRAFLDLLEGKVNEPIPDGYITGEELGLYLKTTVSQYNPAQNPQYGKINDPNLDKGDFVFVVQQGKIKLTGAFAVTHTWTLGSKPPSPSETAAALSLRSEPSGATVYINDVRVGRTPLVEYELGARGKDEEPVTVRLEHDGYNSEELVLNAPPQVQTAARIYWHDGDFRDGKIRRANLDGTNVQVLVTGVESIAALAFDVVESQMYWTTYGKIKRANLDGTNVQVLVTGLGTSGGLALDLTKDKMYWTNWDTGTINRANLNGSDVQVLNSGGSRYKIALDVVGRKMYWTNLNGGKIERASLDGSNAEVLVTGLNRPGGIALDMIERKMYWTEKVGIKRANLDGSNVELFFEETMVPQDIALDVTGRKIYWIRNRRDEPGMICRADLKDSSRVEILIMRVKDAHSIALYFPSR